MTYDFKPNIALLNIICICFQRKHFVFTYFYRLDPTPNQNSFTRIQLALSTFGLLMSKKKHEGR